MFPQYQIFKDNKGEFRFRLWSINGRIILASSEGYTQKKDCLRAVAICQEHAPRSMHYDLRETSDGQHYFILRSANARDIGRSEDYISIAARDNGIDAVKRDGITNTLEDLTVA